MSVATRMPAVAAQPGLPLLAAVFGWPRLRLLHLRAGGRIAPDTRWHGQGDRLARTICGRPVEITAADVSCCHPGAPTRMQESLALLAPLPRSARPARAPQLRRVFA